MEPRPHERGNSCFLRRALARQMCFNGATSSRTWKQTWGKPERTITEQLQWSHVLTNVETNGGVKRPGKAERFNGATSSRTWKPPRYRLFRLCPLRFNGATSSRTWKPGAGLRRTTNQRRL